VLTVQCKDPWQCGANWWRNYQQTWIGLIPATNAILSYRPKYLKAASFSRNVIFCHCKRSVHASAMQLFRRLRFHMEKDINGHPVESKLQPVVWWQRDLPKIITSVHRVVLTACLFVMFNQSQIPPGWASLMHDGSFDVVWWMTVPFKSWNFITEYFKGHISPLSPKWISQAPFLDEQQPI
jgi:hypothetical protein